MSYEFLKFAHALGFVILLGNIIVTFFWKAFAGRTGNPAIIAFSQRMVTITDWLFTAGGVALVLWSGYALAGELGIDTWAGGWVTWGHILFVGSGIIWLTVLIPVQFLQARAARKFANGGEIPASYWRLGRIWTALGIVATILPLANLYVMIVKP